MNEKLLNLLNDPNVNFFLAATPRLKELIVANAHPSIQALRSDVKAELLAGNVIVLDKSDLFNYVVNNGKLDYHGKFLFSEGEIRVVGTPSISVSGIDKGS
jgi:hypothetical protein